MSIALWQNEKNIREFIGGIIMAFPTKKRVKALGENEEIDTPQVVKVKSVRKKVIKQVVSTSEANNDENVEYKDRMFRIMAWGHPWIKIGRSFEELFLNLRYGNFTIIRKAIINRINKWLKRDRHL